MQNAQYDECDEQVDQQCGHRRHLLSKCVWFDVSLSRWTPSGCATLDGRRNHARSPDDVEGDGNEDMLVLCECDHLTEFAVMLYDQTSKGTLASPTISAAEIPTNLSTTMQMLTYLALLVLLLGSIVYSRLVLRTRVGQFKCHQEHNGAEYAANVGSGISNYPNCDGDSLQQRSQ